MEKKFKVFLFLIILTLSNIGNSMTWIQLVNNGNRFYMDIESPYECRYSVQRANDHGVNRFTNSQNFQNVLHYPHLQLQNMFFENQRQEKILENDYDLNQVNAALTYCLFSDQNLGGQVILQNINQIGEGRHVFCYHLLYDQIN